MCFCGCSLYVLTPSHEFGIAIQDLRHHGSKGKENPSGVYGPRNGHEQYVHLMDKGNGVGCGGNFGKMNGGSEIGFA